MPRPEKPVVTEDEQLAEFAQGLRALRRSAGLTLQQLADAAHYSISVLSEAASGKKMPTAEVTDAFVKACGGDVTVWRSRWHALNARAGSRTQVPVKRIVLTADAGAEVSLARAVPVPDAARPDSAPSPNRSRAVALAVSAIVGVVVAIMVVLMTQGAVPAVAVPADYATTTAASPVGVVEKVHARSGAPVFAGAGSTAIATGPIPYGSSVRVLCWVAGIPTSQPAYLIAGPSRWIGLYTQADAFTNGGRALDPRVPACAIS